MEVTFLPYIFSLQWNEFGWDEVTWIWHLVFKGSLQSTPPSTWLIFNYFCTNLIICFSTFLIPGQVGLSVGFCYESCQDSHVPVLPWWQELHISSPSYEKAFSIVLDTIKPHFLGSYWKVEVFIWNHCSLMVSNFFLISL